MSYGTDRTVSIMLFWWKFDVIHVNIINGDKYIPFLRGRQ